MPNHWTGASSWTLASLHRWSSGLVRCTYGGPIWLWLAHDSCELSSECHALSLACLQSRKLYICFEGVSFFVIFCQLWGFKKCLENSSFDTTWRWYLWAIYCIWCICIIIDLSGPHMAALRLRELFSLVVIDLSLYELENGFAADFFKYLFQRQHRQLPIFVFDLLRVQISSFCVFSFGRIRFLGFRIFLGAASSCKTLLFASVFYHRKNASTGSSGVKRSCCCALVHTKKRAMHNPHVGVSSGWHDIYCPQRCHLQKLGPKCEKAPRPAFLRLLLRA